MKINIITLITIITAALSLHAKSKNDTVLTNAEYREFVHWVIDSMHRQLLNEYLRTDKYLVKKKDGEWKEKFNKKNEDIYSAYTDLCTPRYLTNKLWQDLPNSNLLIYQYQNDSISLRIKVYPDTLCWIKNKKPLDSIQVSEEKYHPLSGSLHFAMASTYFWHPFYNNFPVVGLKKEQINAYAHWYNKKNKKEILKLNLVNKTDSIELLKLSTKHWSISDDEYRQYIRWALDSISITLLGEHFDNFCIWEDGFGNELEPPKTDWSQQKQYLYPDEKVKLEYEEVLEDFYRYGTKKYNFHLASYTSYYMNHFMKGISELEESQFMLKVPLIGYNYFTYDSNTKELTGLWATIDSVPIDGLEYNQFYAYFNWFTYHQPRTKADNKLNPTSFYYYPSRKQLTAVNVMNEQIKPPIKIALPTPVVLKVKTKQ